MHYEKPLKTRNALYTIIFRIVFIPIAIFLVFRCRSKPFAAASTTTTARRRWRLISFGVPYSRNGITKYHLNISFRKKYFVRETFNWQIISIALKCASQRKRFLFVHRYFVCMLFFFFFSFRFRFLWLLLVVLFCGALAFSMVEFTWFYMFFFLRSYTFIEHSHFKDVKFIGWKYLDLMMWFWALVCYTFEHKYVCVWIWIKRTSEWPITYIYFLYLSFSLLFFRFSTFLYFHSDVVLIKYSLVSRL